MPTGDKTKLLWQDPKYRKRVVKAMSKARKGKKWNKGWAAGGHHHTKETKKRISKTLKGRKKPPFTEKHKRNIGKTSKGRKHSEETKRKLSKAKRLERHPNWQGGKSFEPYPIDWTETLRRSIRERDRYICQLCGKLQGDRVHSVHHIDYNKENCNPRNLTTLCVECNSKVNFNRKYWRSFFSKGENYGEK